MMKFRKRPIVIEAMRWDGSDESSRAIIDWTRGSGTPACMGDHPERGLVLSINTLEGAHWVKIGDWIIRGVAGEHYCCDQRIFAETYESCE